MVVEIDDPVTSYEDFRTIEFAVFATLSPRVRIKFCDEAISPQPGEFQVLVDDGEDSSDEDLDITEFFAFNYGEAVAEIPETVPIDSLPGPNQSQYRALPTDEETVRVLYVGENRLRFMLRGDECFVGRFLLYDGDHDVVVGINDGDEEVPGDPDCRMMTNHIILDFGTSASDAEMSEFLYDEELRPQGIVREHGAVQVRCLYWLSGQSLLDRVAELASALGDPDAASIDLLTDDPTRAGERQPPAIRGAMNAWTGTGRVNHYQHFVMQTFAAHRLIDVGGDPGATVRVLMAGSGVGTGNDFSGPNANNRNEYFVRGNRMFQATDVTERADGRGGRTHVYNPSANGDPDVGDIRHVADLAPGIGHDSCIMALLAGDGIGNQLGGADRDINHIVLGTGKDVQVRTVRFVFQHFAYLGQLFLSARDPNTRIHLVERSYNTRVNPHLAAPRRNALIAAYRAISNAGKLIVAAAWNENANVANCDAGQIGPDHNTSRTDLAGDNAFKRNVLVVGYSTSERNPNTVEAKGAASNVCNQISVLAPPEGVLGVQRTGAQMQVPGGTSGAAPLVAGVAAEMMLIDPALQQPANIVRVAEMIEATADDIGPAGVGCQTGHGRVNFWKAVLAATNGGLSAEGRTPLANGNDNFFKSLPLRDETHTTWYGFEVRTSVQNVALWLKWDGNRFTKVQDAGQTRPPITGANDADVVTYLSTQPYRTAGATPRPLPSVPFTQAELAGAGVTQRFLARFSIRRDQITGMTALVAAPLDKDPADDPESVIFELPIDDRLDLRRAQGASGDNADLIKALVQDFDDFVFHIDCDPVEQVRACLPDYHEWKVGDEANIPLELKNVGTSNIPVGRWIITGHEDVLAFDNVADFGPLNAGQTKEIPITMRCIAAGQATLHVTILRCANTDRRWVVSTKVGTGGNDSHDGHMTCSE